MGGNISIHALLAESDLDDILAGVNELLISIHALLAESDANWFDLWGWAEYFYPRSPCGERLMLVKSFSDNRHFYPRSPCGERHLNEQDVKRKLLISIHALLAESD